MSETEFEDHCARLLGWERNLARLGGLYRMSVVSGPLGVEPELARSWLEWCGEAAWIVGYLGREKGEKCDSRVKRAIGWGEYWAGRALDINAWIREGLDGNVMVLGECIFREMLMYRRSVGAAVRLWMARGRRHEGVTMPEARELACGCDHCAIALVNEGELPTFCIWCGAVR